MSETDYLSDEAKIPRLQKATGFAIWRIYVIELTRKDNLLHALRDDPLDLLPRSATKINKFKRKDAKARFHIVLMLSNEPTTLQASIILTDSTSKFV